MGALQFNSCFCTRIELKRVTSIVRVFPLYTGPALGLPQPWGLNPFWFWLPSLGKIYKSKVTSYGSFCTSGVFIKTTRERISEQTAKIVMAMPMPSFSPRKPMSRLPNGAKPKKVMV